MWSCDHSVTACDKYTLQIKTSETSEAHLPRHIRGMQMRLGANKNRKANKGVTLNALAMCFRFIRAGQRPM